VNLQQIFNCISLKKFSSLNISAIFIDIQTNMIAQKSIMCGKLLIIKYGIQYFHRIFATRVRIFKIVLHSNKVYI
jgi:multisubunit Na+/H+ antiporter MnhE subunit